MPAPIFYGFNLLQKPGVTFTVPGEAAGFPKFRVHDRRTKFPYVDTASAGTRRYFADQGVSGAEGLHGIAFAAGHNLSGATVDYRTSPDNVVYTTRATVVVAGSGAFVVVEATRRVFRFFAYEITGASAAPSIPESLFTRVVTLPRLVSEPGTAQGLKPNVTIHEMTSGLAWGAEHADPQWRAEYLVRDVPQADRLLLEEWYRDTASATRPFLLSDADGTLRWARSTRTDLNFQAVPVFSHDFVTALVEQPTG